MRAWTWKKGMKAYWSHDLSWPMGVYGSVLTEKPKPWPVVEIVEVGPELMKWDSEKLAYVPWVGVHNVRVLWPKREGQSRRRSYWLKSNRLSPLCPGEEE